MRFNRVGAVYRLFPVQAYRYYREALGSRPIRYAYFDWAAKEKNLITTWNRKGFWAPFKPFKGCYHNKQYLRYQSQLIEVRVGLIW